MIPVTRVDHISFATHSIAESARWFELIFGARVVEQQPVPEEGYTFATLAIPNAQIHFELLEPLGENSFVARFLKERGPGFHHVTLDVDDVDATAAHLKANGITPFGGVRGDEWRQTFIHPRDSNGILVQLVQHRNGESEGSA